ncbi:uncharacterized protein LY89DRAFT_269874 [Mollisia scopiformis]|uniref:Uncharacterized protein n=1 Tax=Mollisia scopiformis TaxID=149040 RepID=A0A132BCE5_MOLSC|nr:uncharacterized protein LY89DRAFT_269874 [Mollisia scopiformis]KUJ10100.1 hypothetical protein LY89DRAFT_269874 [Mollisia scopiformis]
MRSELNLHEKHDTARSYALLPTTERHDSIDQAAELTSERPMHFSSQLFSSHEAKDTILNTLDLDYPFASSSKIPLYNLSQENDAPPTFQLNQEQPHLVNEKLQTESRRFVSPSLDTNSFYPSQESVLDLLAEASTVEILEMQGSHNNKGLEDKSSIHVKRTPSAMAPRPGQSKSSRNLRIRNSQLSQWPICVESESEFEDDTEIGIPHEKSDNFQGFDRPPNSTSASQPETQTSFSVAGEKYAETNAVRSTSANSPALHNTAEHTPASQSEKRRDFSAIPGSQTLLRFLPGGGGWVTEER